MLLNPQIDRHSKNPKKRNYVGPYRVLERCNDVNYLIIDTSNPHKSPQRVHARRLLPFQTRGDNLTYKGENKPQEIQIASESEIQKPYASFGSDCDSSDDDIPLTFLLKKRCNGGPSAPHRGQLDTPDGEASHKSVSVAGEQTSKQPNGSLGSSDSDTEIYSLSPLSRGTIKEVLRGIICVVLQEKSEIR